MTFQNNYSITRSFMTKEVNIIIDNTKIIKINLPTINTLFKETSWSTFYNVMKMDIAELQKFCVVKVENNFDAMIKIMYELCKFDIYVALNNAIRDSLKQIFVDEVIFEAREKQIKVDGLIITREIWDYVFYIIRTSCGEKVTQPLTFESEEARAFYEKQKAYDELIAKTRAKAQDTSKNADEDALGKIFLSIMYSFPSFTIDYLCNQTLAQIQWLQKYAAGAVSYEVNAQAYTAGNMKKGSKLEFFIK